MAAVNDDELDLVAMDALTRVHHAWFLGLQLMVSTRLGREVMGQWMFRLFRRQHEEKFLASFSKLGLDDLPHAVACAKYHVLSNGVGGVPVEYMYENDRKAWVRFRYPRWMYHGPTICGVTEEVSRGFLEGWYGHNGVSLGNPRLGYVCVSEDMTGEFGLCGYFKEYDHDLAPEERLQFAKGEAPPPYDPEAQPQPPVEEWNAARLAKANRNYALEYLRNGLAELAGVIGDEETEKLAGLAARLIGLQYYAETAALLEVEDSGVSSAVEYLTRMFRACGDDVVSADGEQNATLDHSGLRVVRGLDARERTLFIACWRELWVGAMESRRTRLGLAVESIGDDLRWNLSIK